MHALYFVPANLRVSVPGFLLEVARGTSFKAPIHLPAAALNDARALPFLASIRRCARQVSTHWEHIHHHQHLSTMSPASSNAAPPRASLLGLPAELRMVIYELVIPLDPNRFIGTADWQKRITLAIRGALAVEHTCRLLRREIMPILDDPRSPRPSRIELINFTPADMRVWAPRYARNFPQIRHISIELWGGCARNPMIDGHYKSCTFEGTGSKHLNRSCFECPKITSMSVKPYDHYDTVCSANNLVANHSRAPTAFASVDSSMTWTRTTCRSSRAHLGPGRS